MRQVHDLEAIERCARTLATTLHICMLPQERRLILFEDILRQGAETRIKNSLFKPALGQPSDAKALLVAHPSPTVHRAEASCVA